MKESILEILVCPVCKGKLELKGAEKSGNEIASGSLFCVKCNYDYPIKESIPDLLPPGVPG